MGSLCERRPLDTPAASAVLPGAANFFHGVAGNSNLDDPRHFRPVSIRFNRVGFINAERMDTYLKRGIVSSRRGRSRLDFRRPTAWLLGRVAVRAKSNAVWDSTATG